MPTLSHERETEVTELPETAGDEDVFATARPRLLGLAYRMTSVRVDAEDIVQEVWMRWNRADQSKIERPDAWLTTVTTRLAVDRLRARERRKEDYVGPWLPEPIITEPGPEDNAALSDSLTLGFLVVLDQLSSVERAVFLLADVFQVPYSDIAETVGKSEAACRQIASRARRRLNPEVPRRASPEERRVIDELIAALGTGDVATLLARLAPDVVFTSDGGADQRAARRPVVGSDRVARFLVHLAKRYLASAPRLIPASINGDPGFLLYVDGRLDAAMAFEVTNNRVSRIFTVLNRDKLARLGTPADLS